MAMVNGKNAIHISDYLNTDVRGFHEGESVELGKEARLPNRFVSGWKTANWIGIPPHSRA